MIAPAATLGYVWSCQAAIEESLDMVAPPLFVSVDLVFFLYLNQTKRDPSLRVQIMDYYC